MCLASHTLPLFIFPLWLPPCLVNLAMCIKVTVLPHSLSALCILSCALSPAPLSYIFVSLGLLFSSISALAPFFCWICLPQLNILDFHHTCGFSYSWINTSEVNLLFLQLPLNCVTHAVWPKIIARPALWLKAVYDSNRQCHRWELCLTALRALFHWTHFLLPAEAFTGKFSH